FLPLIGVPRLVLALMGGALFGMYYGTLYAVAGSTLASTAVGFYFVIRRSKRREVIDTAQKNVNQ
ncbi:MAG TPA: hypothetical protein DC017_05115, partial [Candidatus Wallbacteria bacterium]|nr:hypothetical protein [Candidatus Wallbacteria bacterium]